VTSAAICTAVLIVAYFGSKSKNVPQCGFYVVDQLLIRFALFVRCWRKKNYNGTVQQLLIAFKIAYALLCVEASIIQYSHRDWSAHEVSQAQ
jgi:hypothetical protein